MRSDFSQIQYADMLNRVEPLRNELQSLEMKAQASKIKVRDSRDI